MPRRFPLFTAVLALLTTLLSPLLVSAGAPQLTVSHGIVKAATSPKATGPLLQVQWPWDLFGRGGSEPDRSSRAPPGGVGHPSPQSERAESRRHRPSSSGTYRTLCVRLCDGFYFPSAMRRPVAALRVMPEHARPAVRAKPGFLSIAPARMSTTCEISREARTAT